MEGLISWFNRRVNVIVHKRTQGMSAGDRHAIARDDVFEVPGVILSRFLYK